MAKGKKKENLTPEERLQAALVPDWEQPYRVPENWCWVKLGTICSLEIGNKHKDEELVYFDVKTLRSAVSLQKRNSGIVVNKNQKVILVDGENSGEVFNIPYRGYMGSTFRIINISNYAEEIYIRYFIGCNQDKLKKNKVGSAIPHLNKELFFGLELPFPPLKEQQRIVDRIESLFAKLDKAKQKAQDALDSFETRKAAILHRAFTGELTAQWRKEHGVGLESWKRKKYSEICDIVRGGSPRPAGSPEFYGGSIPFMKVADITRNTGPYVNSTEYTIKEAGLKKTRIVDADTLLLTNSGATLGVPAICTFQTTFNDGIAAFLGLNFDTLLFHYYFWTSKTADLRAINKGAAQPNLNTDIIGNVEINLPTDREQTEIVRILDNLLAKEQQAKEAAEAVLEQIELIKKSILARAFRGELGTNDPAEESAVELVKQILEKNDEMETKAQTLFKAKS